ncbi:MAG: hypothetical protein ACQGVC_17115 [Myxococcota bacterium]
MPYDDWFDCADVREANEAGRGECFRQPRRAKPAPAPREPERVYIEAYHAPYRAANDARVFFRRWG